MKGKNAIVTPLINKLADASFLKIFNLIIYFNIHWLAL